MNRVVQMLEMQILKLILQIKFLISIRRLHHLSCHIEGHLPPLSFHEIYLQGGIRTDSGMGLLKTYHCLRCHLSLPRPDSHSYSIPQLDNECQMEDFCVKHTNTIRIFVGFVFLLRLRVTGVRVIH